MQNAKLERTILFSRGSVTRGGRWHIHSLGLGGKV